MNDIELWEIVCECICGAECSGRLWLPMFEGEVVDPETHEWGGQPLCADCFRKHAEQQQESGKWMSIERG